MVEKIASIATFQGMSTDDKPTGVPGGSTFHCVDTGDELVFYADGWELDLRKAAAFKRSLTL
jgi:hypothetical protein